MPTLLFIDTNILLDFYRVIGQKEALSILTHIDQNHDKIITGNQVEMEFKKNRQKAILGCLTTLKEPDGNMSKAPAFLSSSQAAIGIEKSRRDIKNRVKRLNRTVDAILRNPSRNDPIFKVCQRLFSNPGPLNLTRDKDIRLKLRELARKRFMLGYPPRKDSDTSIGDAINWEWMIHCAREHSSDLVIASRDSDYGLMHGKEPTLNDWLAQEFRSRVGLRRKVILTDRLANALKLASISVTRKEAREEEEMITSIKSKNTDETFRLFLNELLSINKDGLKAAFTRRSNEADK